MGKRRSMMRAKKYDNAYKRNTMRPWSDLTDDVLSLVMINLGVVDFLAFSRVCKSWRSMAVYNRNKFIVSKPPMSISFSTHANEKEYCYLEDFEGRKLKTILPHSADRTCIGVTCGYLVLFGLKSKDFWLVNPITSHELHFPGAPFGDRYYPCCYFKAILVFSPSISEWVLVVLNKPNDIIWFSKASKPEWTCVSTLFDICDLRVFKGKIYALHSGNKLSEVTLYPTPNISLLEIKNLPKLNFDHLVLVSSGESLYLLEHLPTDASNIMNFSYLMEHSRIDAYKIMNISKVVWVSLEKISDEFVLFSSMSKKGAFVISDLGLQYKRYADNNKGPIGGIVYADMWYFFHDCLNVNLLHE